MGLKFKSEIFAPTYVVTAVIADTEEEVSTQFRGPITAKNYAKSLRKNRDYEGVEVWEQTIRRELLED